MHLPEPFKQSTFEQAADAGGGAGPIDDDCAAGETVPAPWSVVCLASMLHRCGCDVGVCMRLCVCGGG